MSTTTESPRPRPPRTSETAFFWEGVDAGELRIQSCPACAAVQHPPRAACVRCGSLDLEHVVSAGTGTVHSHTTHHHPPVPGPLRPFDVVLVTLDEGVRMLSNLIGPEPGQVAIGDRVAVRFVEVEPGLTLPLFTPLDDGTAGS